jgi:hypothetical protein
MSETVVDPKLQLLQRWNTETNFAQRNVILKQLEDAGLIPSQGEDEIEKEAGLYPDLPDPQSKLYNHKFLEKLLSKQEFIENRQKSIRSMLEERDIDLLTLLSSDASACGPYVEGQGEKTDDEPTMTPFELSPTQRFIGRFLSPKSPYNSALLFHGVGVGKTCSGITVAENFLEIYPRKQVFIVAPPTIQGGWLREIFNEKKLIISKKEGVPNLHTGCTGNTYLRLTSTEFEQNPEVIMKKVSELIKQRYKIVGYLQFYNYVMKYLEKNISKDIDPKIRKEQEFKFLERKFSGTLLIVDEAHNLRDTDSVEVTPQKTSETKPKEVAPQQQVLEEAPPQEEEEEENEIELQTQLGGANNGESDDEEEDDEIDLVPQQQVGTLVGTVVPTKQEDFAGEEKDTPATPEDKQDIIKGKKVTPLLRNKILPSAVGMKFLMLTATPMYNDYTEIILLLNLLLINDKRATIRESQIFDEKGGFVPGGAELLGRIANSYVSFMRGENPLAFPIRLNPVVAPQNELPIWPEKDPEGAEIDDEQRLQITNLPFVACEIPEDRVEDFQDYCADLIQKEKLTIPTTDKLIMAGNFLYPSESAIFAQQIGKRGFDSAFLRQTKPVRFEINPSIDPSWMISRFPTSPTQEISPLEYHSPKARVLLDRIQTTKGVCFVYSRFVETGALTLALILEANGYTCASRKSQLLATSKVVHPLGRQCALCPLHEENHVEHTFEPKEFVPAQYVLLTGEKEYSPNNQSAIVLATGTDNYNGSIVKVILGSTIASEGIDLKFIRELFVFDSWYHLSKLEQVIGRGIRYKSHCALPPIERNCTINLLVLSYGSAYDIETIDMFQYRRGFIKAKQVGQVTRILKQYALDCNLNKELILIQGLGTIQQIDGQGLLRKEVNVNDSEYTNVCDWLETCDYKCKPEYDLDMLEVDERTYDEYAAKWREHQIKKRLRKIFEQQPFQHFDDIHNKVLESVPRIAKASLLEDIVNNRAFRIRVGNHEGYIIYKNGFYLFQPELLWDTHLPLSLRISDFPVKRDSYEPIQIERIKEGKPVVKEEVKKEVKNEVKEDKEEVKEEVKEAEFPQVDQFWKECVAWSRTIAAGTAGLATPKDINTRLESRYFSLGDKKVAAIKAQFEMIGRLATTVQKNEPLRQFFAACVLEYIWDEFLTEVEVQWLYRKYSTTPEMQIASAENILRLGEKVLFRYANPNPSKESPDKLFYICDGKPCEQSIIDGAERSDPISKLAANKVTTGTLYGLNTGMKGQIVFKSNDAVNEGTKPANGRLCSTVSNREGHEKMLNTIGEVAITIPSIATDLDLTTEKIKRVATPARLCALADLAFRLLDKVKPEGKRYFYRPVSAVKTRHESKGTK